MNMGKAAVFTIVNNEKYMLPLWLRYYSRYFDHKDMYVLDHDTTDGSTTGLPCNVAQVHNPFVQDHGWLLHTVEAAFDELALSYETVVFVESDEFLWHPNGLDTFMRGMKKDHARAKAMNLIHVPDKGWELPAHVNPEPPIDLTAPILLQRRYWNTWHHSDKTLINKNPVRWNLGFHECVPEVQVEPNLWLIHLHWFDYGLFVERVERRAAQKWKNDGFGKHWKVQGPELEKQVRSEISHVSLIPEAIRTGCVI